jgi:hypothetical protein
MGWAGGGVALGQTASYDANLLVRSPSPPAPLPVAGRGEPDQAGSSFARLYAFSSGRELGEGGLRHTGLLDRDGEYSEFVAAGDLYFGRLACSAAESERLDNERFVAAATVRCQFAGMNDQLRAGEL